MKRCFLRFTPGGWCDHQDRSGDRREADDDLVFSFLAAEQLLRIGRFGTFPLSDSACGRNVTSEFFDKNPRHLVFVDRVELFKLRGIKSLIAKLV